MTPDSWDDGLAYDQYMGRWSRTIAAQFVGWLGVPHGGAWLDFGCGTGALSQTVLSTASPRLVIGCDRSPAYAAFAAAQDSDPRLTFVVAELPDLPGIDGGFDAVVSGLVLNFLPVPLDGLAAMAARTRRGGVVAAYVWDYGEGMGALRRFWDAASELDPTAALLDEGVQFPVCRRESFEQLFNQVGVRNVVFRSLEIPTVFRDFDDYWAPFLSGQGPAPGYVMQLPAKRRDQLRDLIRSRLPIRDDGTIRLSARAWAAMGIAA
jgi:SAM-dependent methyltransferase